MRSESSSGGSGCSDASRGIRLPGYQCGRLRGGLSGARGRRSGVRSFARCRARSRCFRSITGAMKRRNCVAARDGAGEGVGCFGLTEPDSDQSGRNAHLRPPRRQRLDSQRHQDVDHQRIDRRSRGRVGAGRKAASRVSSFRAIQRDSSPRYQAQALVASVGDLRTRCSRLRLPDDALLPGAAGMRAPLACLDEARFGIMWGAMGAASRCHETAQEYWETRVQFDSRSARIQLTQAKLVDMLLELDKGAARPSRGPREGRRHGSTRRWSVSAKLNNVREAIEIARASPYGPRRSGVTLEYPVIRHMSNLESVLTYEGTTEMHTFIVGKAITGLAAFISPTKRNRPASTLHRGRSLRRAHAHVDDAPRGS